MRFGVVLPTFDRARTLERAIRSVIAQTHADWRLLVLDDGSADETPRLSVLEPLADPRMAYIRYEENRGGVAMNEIGMGWAADACDAWTRLGSDDLFLPRKLELDAIALEDAGICFGPYRHTHRTGPGWAGDGEGNGPQDARAVLLGGAFAVSWANIAVRSDVLRKVRGRHGAFCDPRLRNMEDWLFNVRAARFSEVVWRGVLSDGRICVGAREPFGAPPDVGYEPDACYTLAGPEDEVSATYSKNNWSARDMGMTGRVRGEDYEKGLTSVEDVPKPETRYA